MKLSIIGDGSFGSFLKELLGGIFELTNDAESVILAVPVAAYLEAGKKLVKENPNRHLINVCSVQGPSTDALLNFTEEITSLHPLFGRRTPENKRHSILTRFCGHPNEHEFLLGFGKVSTLIVKDPEGKKFTPETHDKLMFRTHVAALLAARQMKIYVDRTKEIPDEMVPNSFRLLREFVKTMDDMPQGTIDSILANPNF